MASQKKLQQLFNALVDELVDQIGNGTAVTVKTDDGVEVHRVSTNPSTLNCARQFLRDLNIGPSDPADHDGIRRLTDSLPFDTDPESTFPN